MTRLPAGIWALGFVSLLMDVSSEMVHGLLPVFLTVSLGAGPALVGLVEGLGEAVAATMKLASGRISDRMRRRKPLALAGYALGALSKPVFALAGSPAVVLGARVADRIGKGLRGSPRDALIADLTPPERTGAAYGLRQALDNVGAFVGPGLAALLMVAFAGDMRRVFAVAAIPGLAAVALLALAVREPERPAPAAAAARPGWGALPGAVWRVIALAAFLTLARMSEAFAILRATDLGLPLALAPLVLVVIYAAAALASYPAGALSDRIGPRQLLLGGLAVLAAADAVLAMAPTAAVALAGAALWGVHLGLTQGLLSAMVARATPAELRGTAFGAFHFASGVALLAASGGAGLIWQGWGAPAAFAASGALALAGLALLARNRSESRD